MYQDQPRALCTLTKGRAGPAGAAERHGTHLSGVFMVRLKIAVAAAVAAGVLAGGLAMPSAASADTTQIVYAWGYNAYGQAGADPAIAGDHVLSAVPVQGAAANVTQLAGGTGRKGRHVRPVAALGRHRVGLGPERFPPAG
jgi:hypothetical protein